MRIKLAKHTKKYGGKAYSDDAQSYPNALLIYPIRFMAEILPVNGYM